MSLNASKIGRLGDMLRGARRIACLTGAGMSTESGVPDFRSKTGIYRTLCSEEVFDIDRFQRRPQDFYRVIAPVYGAMRDASPNAGHLALMRLERDFGKDVCVATQNIDGLHQKAGSAHVHELHGTMMSLTCQACGGQVPASCYEKELRTGEVLTHAMTGCRCTGTMKPDIVFYGEGLPEDAFMDSMEGFRSADLVLVLGTSLAVYPAASLPGLRSRSCRLVIVNLTPTPLDDAADLVFHDSIGEVLQGALA